MELGPTSYVILGLLALGAQSGYDIKQLADMSTRHFWATSYGQIYPELRRLTQSGLIKAEDASRGNRERTLYHLTAEGRKALRAWVADGTVQAVAMRRRHQEVAAGLREHEPMVAAQPHRMKYEVLKFGVALHEWCADWYGRLAKDMESGKQAKK